MIIKALPRGPMEAERAKVDTTSDLLMWLAQFGRVSVSGGQGIFGGGPDEWHASLTMRTPGQGELRFTNPGTAPTSARALHDLKERVDAYMNHGGGR